MLPTLGPLLDPTSLARLAYVCRALRDKLFEPHFFEGLLVRWFMFGVHAAGARVYDSNPSYGFESQIYYYIQHDARRLLLDTPLHRDKPRWDYKTDRILGSGIARRQDRIIAKRQYVPHQLNDAEADVWRAYILPGRQPPLTKGVDMSDDDLMDRRGRVAPMIFRNLKYLHMHASHSFDTAANVAAVHGARKMLKAGKAPVKTARDAFYLTPAHWLISATMACGYCFLGQWAEFRVRHDRCDRTDVVEWFGPNLVRPATPQDLSPQTIGILHPSLGVDKGGYQLCATHGEPVKDGGNTLMLNRHWIFCDGHEMGNVPLKAISPEGFVKVGDTIKRCPYPIGDGGGSINQRLDAWMKAVPPARSGLQRNVLALLPRRRLPVD